MQYMVRIEMHREGSEAYRLLKAAEKAQGFSHTLTAEGSGNQRGTPTGVCWMETPNDAWFVLEAAKRAVLPIDPDAMILVAGGPQFVYHGYPKPSVAVSSSPLAAMLHIALTAPPVTPVSPIKRRLASNLLGPPAKTPASDSTSLASSYLATLLTAPTKR